MQCAPRSSRKFGCNVLSLSGTPSCGIQLSQSVGRLALVLFFLFLGDTCAAAEGASGNSDSTSSSALYNETIKPMLAEKCVACHGALKQESGLRLDHGSFIHRGGDSGHVLAEGGDVEASELLRRVLSSEDGVQMPPHGEGAPLDADQVKLLQQWLSSGAATPADEAMPIDPDQHWAWQPPEKSPLPDDSIDQAWTHNPIDRFIAHQYRVSTAIEPSVDGDSVDGDSVDSGDPSRLQSPDSLLPTPLADPRTRVRRLYFDLIGLPPPPDVLAEFEKDPSAKAWQSLVDGLLARPEYGERWARHWMDVWRYSDWDGYKNQVRGSQRHVWRWRDWIIQSLNEDKSYDRMVMEMLAGDELEPTNESVLAATGFLVRNYHNSNRNIWLDATVEHTAKAFVGLTINCARCHDHKYDPISQQEYYAWRAVFEPHHVRTERLPGELNTVNDGLVRAYDANLEEPTYLYIGGDEKSPDESEPVLPDVPKLAGLDYEVAQVNLPILAAVPGLKPFVEQDEIAAARAQVDKAQSALEALSQSDSKEPETPSPLREAARQLAVCKLQKATAELTSLRARWHADRYRFEHELTPSKYACDRVFSSLRHNAKLESLSLDVQVAALAVAELQYKIAELLHTEKVDSKKFDADALKKNRAELAKKRKKLEEVEARLASLEAGPLTEGKPAAGAKAAAGAKPADEGEAAAEGESATEEKDDELGYKPVVKTFPMVSTGRRLALANWIVDRRNPLTSRVAINYIWMNHFGKPIVDNVFDFGMRSPEPEHLELLDWLSIELMENGWSLKHIHRLIATSRVYQLSSNALTLPDAAREKNQELDPDNRLFWRGNIRRLQAEVVRDSLLAVAGSLKGEVGGPEINFQKGETVYRRSLYFRTAYEKQMSMLVIFDAAAPNECYRRSESIVPQQALALSNSPLALDQSRRLARNLWAAADFSTQADEAKIRHAFEVLLARPCTESEYRHCQSFLENQEQLLSNAGKLNSFGGEARSMTEPSKDPAMRARENLIHALVNHNDFVTVR